MANGHGNLPQLTCEIPVPVGTGVRCSMVWQNPKPYLHLHDPFRKYHVYYVKQHHLPFYEVYLAFIVFCLSDIGYIEVVLS